MQYMIFIITNYLISINCQFIYLFILKELMSLWCDFQVCKQRTASEIQDAAKKLLIGHASSSAQFYLFVDILWGKVLLLMYFVLFCIYLNMMFKFLHDIKLNQVQLIIHYQKIDYTDERSTNFLRQKNYTCHSHHNN